MGKKKIEKGSVQETLLLPLYGRKRAMEMYPGNFNDLDCQRIYNEVEIDYNRKGIMEKIGAIMAATRQYDLASVSDRISRIIKSLCCEPRLWSRHNIQPGG